MAEELDRRGFLQRGGAGWTQVAVFNMLPRLIEMAPRIYSSAEWQARKERLIQVAG